MRDVLVMVEAEVRRAEQLWPGWPRDAVHAAAVVADESGEMLHEVMRAAYRGGDLSSAAVECVQVAATAIRWLIQYRAGELTTRPDPGVEA